MKASPKSRFPGARRLPLLLLVAASGPLLLPVAAYVAGGRLVGPYAGSRGLASYLESIYGDALAGGALALAVVLGPVLIVVAWSLRRRLLQRFAANESD